jgi:DNA-directed RNA polymerase specialized sigma subunit
MPTKKEIKDVEKFIKDAATSPAKVERATQRYDELRGRRGKELELFHNWNSNGRQPEHLEPLLKSLDPLIRSETSKRMQGLGGSIAAPAMKNELRLATMKALESFDPKRGTQLTTHVVNNFMRITDFVAANRNSKYMPREDVDRYQTFMNAKTEFAEEHGREPTAFELQQKLPNWRPAHVTKMMRGFGSEAFTDMGTDLEHDVQPEDQLQRVRSAVHLMRTTLTPEEQQFADLHYPAEGVQQKSVSAIAKALKIPEHKAYRIKKRVEGKLAPVIKGQ